MNPQQENNGFGPISKPRGKADVIAATVFIVVSGVAHLAHASGGESKNKIQFLIFGTAFVTLCLVFGELVRRMCLFFEEIQHKETRYEGSLKNVFKTTFTFRSGRSILVVFVVSVLIVCYSLHQNYNTFFRSDYLILFTLSCFLVPLLLFLVGFRELSIVEISQINERKNKNVADGLAWSYYFGYLKLVLPKLEQQIAKSEEYRFKITKKKLFILLPKTCYTYDTIDKADPRVKGVGQLPKYEKNRGGILKRSYQHTVHRIEMKRPDGEVDEYHVILEYATPLMSLYDMSQHPEGGLSRHERDEQVVLFIRKLKEILDGCQECEGKYELVLISGEAGEENQIADVLVQMHHDAAIQLNEGAEAE